MIKELHVSKNLFDATAVSKGRINSSTGAIEYAEDTPTLTYSDTNNEFTITTRYAWRGFVTEYLDLQEKPAFSYISNDGTFFAFSYAYDANKNFLGTITSSVPIGTKYIRVSIQCSTVITNAKIKNIMLNTGSTALPYEPYGDTWNTKSYAKIVDTTQQVTSFPVVVRPMENTIPSWTIKGNMVQDGTPSPSNIIYPSETGERTGNLFDVSKEIKNTYITNHNATGASTVTNMSDYTEINATTITLSGSRTADLQNSSDRAYCFYTDDKTYIDGTGTTYPADISTPVTITVPNNAAYIRFSYDKSFEGAVMLNTGSTPLPYQPYGYVLPIKAGSTTTPVYLGQVVSTRRIKKLVLTGEEGWVRTQNQKCYYVNASTGCPTDYLKQTITTSICSHYQSQNNTASGSNEVEAGHFCFFTGGGFELYIAETTISSAADFKTYLQQQYANGTPVTVWYVLATETTSVVNEPLRKIGTYSDSVSGTNLSVTAHSPTTIDVDTSLKPSEMDLTYTGLKMCGRKKYAHGNSPQILPSAKAESRTSGNITLTCDGNGVYTLVGSPTPNTNLTFNIPPTEIPLSVGEGGNGTLSLFNDSVYNNFDITFVYQGTQYREAVTYSPNTINKTSTTYGSNSSDIGGKTIISIGVHITGYGNINCTFSPMITNDGQLPSTFQPYCSWQ